MKSKWYELKPTALRMRKSGLSIRDIEAKLRIPRSTLSGWLRGVDLSKKQHGRLYEKWIKGLTKARLKAVLWHNQQKSLRLEAANREATATLVEIEQLDSDPLFLELALAFLYLGEGAKKAVETSIGNSEPLLLKFFIVAVRKLYDIDPSKIRCELHLRADQKPSKLQRYWAKELALPLSCFTTVTLDQRTAGTKTYPSYHGVCAVRVYDVSIQRKLLALSRLFCGKTISHK